MKHIQWNKNLYKQTLHQKYKSNQSTYLKITKSMSKIKKYKTRF